MLWSLVGLLLAVELIDPLARPRGRRSLVAWPFRIGPTLFVFGCALIVTGRPASAAVMTAVLLLATMIGSNLKRRVLGEPLLFSDAATVREMVRHPHFYLGAITLTARVALVIVLALLLGLLLLTWSWSVRPRLGGVALVLLCRPFLDQLARMEPWRRLMIRPALDDDLARHGLLATVWLYWRRWRLEPCAPAAAPAASAIGPDAVLPDLFLVVQCESFADPSRLGPEVARRAPALPSLARAQARAVRWGRLAVSGFGAYTMRTEYGVLFGQEEAVLGFRRFDPFLTAIHDRATALPARLFPRVPNALFVHPHDLSFYGRNRLMPAIGFNRMLGQDAFADDACQGPHVGDAALGDRLIAIIREARTPTLIYTVTIENHGPWKHDRPTGAATALDSYLAHLCHGDQLLGTLIDALDTDGRPALLAFFGDHRPSIPHVSVPGNELDTPFVLLRFPQADSPTHSVAPETLTPASLHHAILEVALAGGGPA